MNCPLCDGELIHWDSYGRICAHQDGKILGEIYKCLNGAEQDGSCDSEVFSCPGSFYTDEAGNLHDGYPC